MLSVKSVFALLRPGCIVAAPFICTAPTREAGVTSEARHRVFRFTSRLTSVTGSRRNGLHAPSANSEVESSDHEHLGTTHKPSGKTNKNRWSETAVRDGRTGRSRH